MTVKKLSIAGRESDSHPQVSAIRFAHEGEVLLAKAQEYPLLIEAVMEIIQNACDSGASHIGVVLNQKTRRVIVTDNGSGVTKDDFEESLCSIGKSRKNGVSGKYGRFGIGLVSPIDKCLEYLFTSCPEGSDSDYKTWTFRHKDILAMKTDLSVPWEREESLRFSRNAPGEKGGIKYVPYRTRVCLMNYTKDKTVNRIDSAKVLAEGIAERYSVAIRDRNVVVSISFTDEKGNNTTIEKVVVQQYSGKKLKEVTLTDPDAGETTFKLYSRKDQKGTVNVLIKGNDFPLTIKKLAVSLNEYIPKEIIDALLSGMFDGEIVTTHPELHRNRRQFVQDDACVGFYAQIEEWFNEYGADYLREVRDTTSDERFQRVGVNSLKSLAELFKRPENSQINDFLSTLKQGTVGKNHTETGKEGLEQELKSLAVNPGEKRGGSVGESVPENRGTRGAKEEHRPYSVVGPKGSRRIVTRNDSLGLQFIHSEMPGSSKLWKFDPRNGIFEFNIRHPEWELSERSDSQLMRLQEFIAVQVLSVMSTTPPDWQDRVLISLDEVIAPMLWVFRNSFAFNMRVPKDKK